MQFFNFGNNETFHFFKWITESFSNSPETLIAEAFKRAEEPKGEDALFDDICYAVRDRLEEKLREILYDDIAPDLDPDINSLLEIGEVWRCPNEQESADLLLNPIFALALSRIDCQTVAEALLVQSGKWTPSKVRPDAM